MKANIMKIGPCTLVVTALSISPCVAQSGPPLGIGIVGLVHGHVDGFLKGAVTRTDIKILGVAESDRSLFDRYAGEYHLPASLYFSSIDEMIERTHPAAVVVYTDTFRHRAVVEDCARHNVHVMMEKPLAVSYKDALAMQSAAAAGKIHVLVNYETTWYASNTEARNVLNLGKIGAIRKVVVRDGHEGPKEIHVQPEFFKWLTNPELNGAGALFDFGCYGADLSTWLHKGEIPETVTAVTQQIKPDIYPHVEDEANVILTYRNSVAVLEPSWNWPFSIKDLQVYGRTGYVKTIEAKRVDIRIEGEKDGHTEDAPPLQPPYDDSLHYLAAVIAGRVDDHESLSSLGLNVLVTEILDAARTSAKEGRTVHLPLNEQ
jgi:predicted dehydrogenase